MRSEAHDVKDDCPPNEPGDSPPISWEQLYERVRKRIEALHLRSEAEACTLAGLPRGSIREIRRGKVPRYARMVALAHALHCSPNWLAYGHDANNGSPLNHARMHAILVWARANLADQIRDPDNFAETVMLIYGRSNEAFRPEELSPEFMAAFKRR